MTRYGFIGTGSMGSMLVRRFIAAGQIAPAAITASSKTRVSARVLAAQTGIAAAETNRAVARDADVLFICVKPLVVRSVLAEVKDQLKPGTLLVSIAGCVTLHNLREWAGENVRCVRVIPSVTAEQDAGVSLVAWGDSVRPEDKALVLGLLNAIGTAVEVDEKDFDPFTDLTSCGPALIAEMMRQFAEAGARHGIDREDAWEMVLETLQGAALALSSGESAASLKEKVATKGGITEQGLLVLEAELPAVFDQVMERTTAKHAEVRKRLMREIAP